MDRRKHDILTIYNSMYEKFGPQYWWPGETPFEVIVGAILTQNTSWKNVEKAIASLKTSGNFSPERLYELPIDALAGLIRSSGYFNIKARRLKNFLSFLFDAYKGSIDEMLREDCSVLRERLLNVNGLGPETVDSILLYAGEYPVFVVDAYTKRIFLRHGFGTMNSGYTEIQSLFMENIPKDPVLYNEYHALIVRIGKDLCKKNPNCIMCPLEYDLQK